MKSNAPWSVKGIERDARDAAKEAAKREGMTVGEWLNQMIYAAGDPEESDGNIEGLHLADIVTAIEHLHKRVAENTRESAEGLTELSRKTGEVVERVQRLERGNSSLAPPDMEERLVRLEQMGGDRERVDALKALEKAVAQVAVQFNNAQKASLERLDATESQVQQLASRFDNAEGDTHADESFLKDSVDGLSLRLSRAEKLVKESVTSQQNSSEQASNEDFLRSTENRFRVLGDEIKRSGDQIRTLETSISKLASQIEAAERRSAEGVHKTAETLSDLHKKFSAAQLDGPNKDDIEAVVAHATSDTVERVDRLQSSFQKMIEKLEALSAEDLRTVSPHTALVNRPRPATGETENSVSDEIEGMITGQPSGGAGESQEFEPEASEDPQGDGGSLPPTDATSPNALTRNGKLEGTETIDSSGLESDDDFFAFADDIEEEDDEAPQAEDEDDFSFELDDDEPSLANKDSSTDETGDAELLSEIQSAFSGSMEEDDPVQTENDQNTPANSELDELLASLDDASSVEAPGRADEKLPFANSQTEDDSKERAKAKVDYLKATREKAKLAAQGRSKEEAEQRKRKLTPKQKAILAARARKKKLAREHSESSEIENQQKRTAAKKALAADQFEDDVAENPDISLYADEPDGKGLAARFSGLKEKLPFFSEKKNTENDEEAGQPSLDPTRNGDWAALETLKQTASARPVTLALGIGIFLAVSLLFFMIKDVMFAPRDQSSSPQLQDTAANNPETATTLSPLEAPSPPAIDPRTLYSDAMTGLNAAETAGESDVAIQKLKESALLGFPPAQLQLGELYKTGQGVEADPEQARLWFRRSANGGNVLAMHRIGVMAARGEGGPEDTLNAINWFEQAANRGLVDSQYNLGRIYHPTADTEPDPLQDSAKAYYWYSLAAQNGDTQAATLASGVSSNLSDSQREELNQSIAEWQPMPSDVEANELAMSN